MSIWYCQNVCREHIMPSEKRTRCVGGDDVSLKGRIWYFCFKHCVSHNSSVFWNNQKVPIAAYDRDSIHSDSSMVYMEIVIFIWAIWALWFMIYELQEHGWAVWKIDMSQYTTNVQESRTVIEQRGISNWRENQQVCGSQCILGWFPKYLMQSALVCRCG